MPPAQPGQQQYYQHYAAPPPPPAKEPTSPVLLVGAGVVLAVGGMKAMEFMGGKKGDMQSMMMQQMMKQAMKQAGGGAGGAGAPGGMPGFPPMGGAPGGFPTPGMGSTPPAGFPPFPGATTPPATPTPAAAAAAEPAVDVTANEVKKEAAPAASTTAAAAPKEKTPAATMGSGSFFSDATDEAGPSTETPPPNPFEAASATVEGEPVSEGGEDDDDVKYMQEMLRNPKMQEMMYPYLPEMMRNPETFEMLLNNPMYKDQLKDIMKQMKESNGAGMEGMPDMNSPEVQEQFAAMGMTPQQAIEKLMQDPELAMAFQNPKIQQAVMDCSSNPNNIMKYQSDPEIMNVFMKLATMFPGAAAPGMPTQ